MKTCRGVLAMGIVLWGVGAFLLALTSLQERQTSAIKRRHLLEATENYWVIIMAELGCLWIAQGLLGTLAALYLRNSKGRVFLSDTEVALRMASVDQESSTVTSYERPASRTAFVRLLTDIETERAFKYFDFREAPGIPLMNRRRNSDGGFRRSSTTADTSDHPVTPAKTAPAPSDYTPTSNNQVSYFALWHEDDNNNESYRQLSEEEEEVTTTSSACDLPNKRGLFRMTSPSAVIPRGSLLKRATQKASFLVFWLPILSALCLCGAQAALKGAFYSAPHHWPVLYLVSCGELPAAAFLVSIAFSTGPSPWELPPLAAEWGALGWATYEETNKHQKKQTTNNYNNNNNQNPSLEDMVVAAAVHHHAGQPGNDQVSPTPPVPQTPPAPLTIAFRLSGLAACLTAVVTAANCCQAVHSVTSLSAYCAPAMFQFAFGSAAMLGSLLYMKPPVSQFLVKWHRPLITSAFAGISQSIGTLMINSAGAKSPLQSAPLLPLRSAVFSVLVLYTLQLWGHFAKAPLAWWVPAILFWAASCALIIY